MLKIEEKTAKKLYPEAPDWFQDQLIDAFGKECFTKKDFTSIKTFNDACIALGASEEEFNRGFEKIKLSSDTINYEKLKIIVKAINQGWTPDWNDTNQAKWFPYFKVSSGFAFSVWHYNYTTSLTSVGSRLCFESEEKSNYAAKQFTDIYKHFLL